MINKEKKLLLAAVLGIASLGAMADECAVGHLEQADNGKAQSFAQHLEQSNPCTVKAGISGKSLKTVWSTFLSNSRTGGKRFDTPPPKGSPTGTVMPSERGVEFDFSDIAAEGLKSFTLDANGARLEQNNKPQVKFAIPAAKLDEQATYSWQLVTGQNSYHGQFHLLALDDRKEVESRLAELKKAKLDADSYLLYAAAIYDDAELYSARDQAFAELGKHIGMSLQ